MLGSVIAALMAAVVLGAAFVKGAIGFGFPTLGTPLLSLVVDVKTAVVVLILPNIMEAQGFSEAEGIRAMVWYVIGLTPVCVGLVVMLTPETLPVEVKGQRFRARDYLELITHPSMARILLADLCLTLGPGWMSALFLFFSRDRMHFTTGQANQLLIVYIIAGLLGVVAPLRL